MTGLSLRTGGLHIRTWDFSDAASLHRSSALPTIARQVGGPMPDEDAATRWIEGRLADWAVDSAYATAVLLDDRLVGAVGISSVDRRHHNGWVWYWTLPNQQRSGIATTATRAITRWAFDDLKLHRLELGHRVDNEASCKVATRSGFRPEGVQRDKLTYDGQWFDVELHARLSTDHDPDDEPVDTPDDTPDDDHVRDDQKDG